MHGVGGLAARSRTVHSGITSDTERSITGLSWSSSRTITHFDYPESLSDQPSSEFSADVVVTVYFVVFHNTLIIIIIIIIIIIQKFITRL